MFTLIWLIFMGNVGNHTSAGPMDPLGILCGVGELAAVETIFCDFQASTQEEGEIFQLLKDLFLQICHH